MQAYCINREQYDFVLEVTKFKSKAEWAADPVKSIETRVKSAFTRAFNKQVRRVAGSGPRVCGRLPELFADTMRTCARAGGRCCACRA